jgi:hypothetical protein
MSINRKLDHREEQARLNLTRIWTEKYKETRLIQMDVNDALGWSPSVFGQYLQGRLALHPRATAKLARFFEVRPEVIDPGLVYEFQLEDRV